MMTMKMMMKVKGKLWEKRERKASIYV